MTMMTMMTTMAMEARAMIAVIEKLLVEEENIAKKTFQLFLEMCSIKPCMIGMQSMKKWQVVLMNMWLWDPSETCMLMKMHLYALQSVLMTEQMKNRMITTMMKLIMSMVRGMEARMAAMVIATTMVKVVLQAMQSVATLMQPLLAVEMVDLVMFPRKNNPRKLQTRE
jgi:hypothetical protein